ncbi:histone-lysine n-methyltransferase setmar-like protein [Elysia marginata]|uniref:Histone-lysine n-methyltransferase setmar-like protein n=1 Tax=Elysia marginata TaxID=1093978 RepID=A0AAV4F7F8_9GAST|nr:histone-lysine n-methyltransferase setmar-like protein [Elysia marginata]
MVDVTLNRSDINGNLCQISSSYAFWLLIYGGGKLIYETDLVSNVRRWTRRSREENPSESTVHDQARTSRPLSASDSKHQSRVDQLIRENCRVKQIDISIEIGISQERVHHIITNLLGYRKVSARWVPRMLTPQMKLQRVQICRELLAKFDDDGEDFLRQIVTNDEPRIHHYDPESKQQSKEYRHKTSPSPKKFKCFLPHGRCFSRSFGTVRVWFTQNF